MPPSERELAAQLLRKGDLIRVIRGARVPADGTVEHGHASVDEYGF